MTGRRRIGKTSLLMEAMKGQKYLPFLAMSGIFGIRIRIG
jgi:AAA+ ATPase superfamily predicted ATPase